MSTLPSSGPVPQDVAKITGPLLLGQLLHWGLFGALSVQVYIYYLTFAKDPLHRKVLVYGVYATEIVQTILFSKIAYTTLAAGFGDFEALNKVGLLWFAVPILSTILAFAVQIFYAYRIKLLAQSNLLSMVVVLFALLQLGAGIAQGVIAHGIPTFSNLVKKTFALNSIWNGSNAVCDILIAASMTYYLSRWKTTWKSTQRKMQQLTRLFIETGTLTAAVQIFNLILFLLPGNQAYYEITSGILGIIYATTMMVVLNSRIEMSHHDSPPDEPLPLLALNSGGSRRSPGSSFSNGGILGKSF